MAQNVMIQPVKQPYLQPSQRGLKAEQIGPSSHKNVYHVGVLEGNWAEERAAFDQKFVKAPIDSNTIYKASFQATEIGKRQDPTPHGEVDKVLLFGHGDDFSRTSFVTMNELFYTNPYKDAEPIKVDKAIKLDKAPAPSKEASGYDRSQLTAKKRQQWEAENNADYYLTTKNVTIDASGKFAKEHQVYEPGKTRTCSECVQSLDSDYHKMELRAPVPLSRSPLI